MSRWGKIAVWLVIAAALAWATPRLADFLTGGDEPQPADAIVALAGGRRSVTRLEAALQLARDGYATNLVVSGVEYNPQHPGFDRPAWELLQQNLATGRVIVDADSDMTQKTARFVRELAKREGWRDVLVVTSDFHWRRARGLFRYECEPAVSVRVYTIHDQPLDQWWRDPYQRRIVWIEYSRLMVFILFHSTYGVRLLAGLLLVGIGIVLAKRLIP